MCQGRAVEAGMGSRNRMWLAGTPTARRQAWPGAPLSSRSEEGFYSLKKLEVIENPRVRW